MRKEYTKPQTYYIQVGPADGIAYNFPGSMSMPLGNAKDAGVSLIDDEEEYNTSHNPLDNDE